MFVVTDVNIQIGGVSAGGNNSGMYEMVGPKANLNKLIGMCKMVDEFKFTSQLPTRSSRKMKQAEQRNYVKAMTRGPLSPLSAIQMGRDERTSLGIPLDARYLAFVHPAKALEKALEATNISDEPWAYLLLLGGFAFFDEERKLQSVNALSLTPTHVEMQFQGPHVVQLSALASLRKQGRLHEVFLDALQDQGLRECTWVHPNEKLRINPGDDEEPSLSISQDHPHNYGALVYVKDNGEGICFPVALNLESLSVRKGDSTISSNDLFHKMKSKITRDFQKMKIESANVAKFTESDASRGLKGILALVLVPLLSCMVTVVTLGSLARYDTRIFDIVATLLWFNLYIGTTWRPLHDTAGVGIWMHSPMRLMCIRAFLAAIPVVLTLALTFTHVAHWKKHDAAIEHVHVTIKVMNEFLVFVALPGLIHYFRSITCRDVIKDMGVKYDAVNQLARVSVKQYTTSPSLFKTASISQPSVESSEEGDRGPQPALLLATQSPPPSPPSPPEEADVREGSLSAKVVTIAPEAGTPIDTTDSVATDKMDALAEHKITVEQVDVSQSDRRGQGRARSASRGTSKSAPAKKSARRASMMKRTQVKRIGEVLYDVDLLPPLGFTAQEVAVAIKLQLAFRSFQARKRMREEREARVHALRYFSVPIYVWTLFKVASGSVLGYLDDNGIIDHGILYSLLPLIPCIICLLVKDLRKEPLPSFSLAHGVFFVAVLYRLCFVATKLGALILFELQERYGTESALPPIGAMTFHYALYTSVTAIGGLTLSLVATKNACVHLMFFFQFFDFFFVYIFFNLRSINADAGITVTWFFQQVLMQAVVCLRNSGTTDALTRIALEKITAAVGCQQAMNVTLDDPLYRLQYLARMAIQYDIADWTSVLLTPSIVTFFVWRDGYFTLENTGIFVNSCLLRGLWARFLLLLLFKPIGSSLGRLLMNRKMRKTLLGKKTLHGRSQVIIKALSAHKVSLTRSTLGEASRGMFSHKEAKAQEDLGLTEEQRFAIGDELLMSAMNYRVLIRKQLKHIKFYTMVMLLQLFVALPVRQTAIKEVFNSNVTDSIADMDLNRSNYDLLRATYGKGANSTGLPDLLYVVAQQTSWIYVPPVVRYHTDGQLQTTLQSSRVSEDVVACTSLGWQRRFNDPGLSVFLGLVMLFVVVSVQLMCMRLMLNISPQEWRALRKILSVKSPTKVKQRPARKEAHDEIEVAAVDCV